MASRTTCSPTPSPLPTLMLLPPPPILWFSDVSNGYQTDQNQILRVAMIVFASTVGVFLFLFTLLKIMGYCYSRRYELRRGNLPILFDIRGDSPFSDDDAPAIDLSIFIDTVGLQPSIIDSITVCKYRKDEGLIEGTECSVCLCEFQEDESLRLLPKCRHAFHIPCIDTWLRSHKNCPLCRAPIVHGTGGGGTEVSVPELDLNFSDQNEETQIENLGDGVGNHHIGEGQNSVHNGSGILPTEDPAGATEVSDTKLPNSGKMKCHSPIVIDLAASRQKVKEEIQAVRRSVSADTGSASMIYGAVMDLDCDVESSDTQLEDKRNSCSKNMAIAKPVSGSSNLCKMASMGRALQKMPMSLKSCSSHN